MVDSEKAIKLIADRKYIGKQTRDNYPWMDRDFWNPIVSALGDDFDDILAFFDSCTTEQREYLSEVFDDLLGKFYTGNKEHDDAIYQTLHKRAQECGYEF